MIAISRQPVNLIIIFTGANMKGIEALKLIQCNEILFQMWLSIESGQFNSRSFVGDLALDLRGILFKSEEEFWAKYTKWVDSTPKNNKKLQTGVCAHVFETVSGSFSFLERCSTCGEERR